MNTSISPAPTYSIFTENFYYIWHMASLQVDILNPKAGKLLKSLADMNLIAITELNGDDNFLKTIKKIRSKAKKQSISLEEITKEVESVRLKRYAKAKR